MITVTHEAQNHLRDLIPEPDRAAKGLRLYIAKGGCSGLQYEMTIAEPQENDIIIDCGDVKIFLDSESSKFLKGSTLDYECTLTNTGFRIHNPNAKQTCGCGTSFEPDAKE